MVAIPDSFTFDDADTEIVYGRGCVDRLGELLTDRNLERALVVCGSNVGANDAVMDPLKAGLGDRLAGVFDETTPEKSVATVADGVEALAELDADVLVGVGGGSSLDIARQTSAFAADDRPVSAFLDAARDGESPTPEPDEPLTPVIVIPTTFAGAGISSGGTVELLSAADSPTGQPIRTGGTVPPTAAVYDPALYETTPTGALAGSAMNGFDKGVETIYAEDATPITDATAIRGLRLLSEGLPELSGDDPEAMERAVTGLILVQFERRISVVHAFAHGFARRYSVQQGAIHAVLAPHVFRYVFEEVGGRRDVVAEAFGVDSESDEVGERVVAAVEAVRNDLEVPTRLREIDPVDRADFPAIAEFVVDDPVMERAPAGLDPTPEDIEAVLDAAW